jgi:uncharacterized iron-regulated membrane protein
MPRNRKLRRLMLMVHLTISLVAGIFITILGLTGSILAFEPEVDRLFHPRLSYVAPGGTPMSLSEVGRIVSRNFDGEPVVAYLPASSPDHSAEVILPRGAVYVNPYTGAMLGVRVRGQTFLGLVRALHVRLGIGGLGRNVMKWSGAILLLSLASGLYLWWPSKRASIHGSLWSKRFWFDVHNSLGILSLLPLFVLALTGTVIGFEDEVDIVLNKLAGSHAAAVQDPPTGIDPRPQHSTVITPDEAVAIAYTQLPGAIAYRVQMPQYGGLYKVSLLDRQDRMAGARNLVSIDPCSGRVVGFSSSMGLSARDRFFAANEVIHTAEVFGTPSKVIASLVSAALPLQVLSGLLIWWRRKPVLRTDSPTEEGVTTL